MKVKQRLGKCDCGVVFNVRSYIVRNVFYYSSAVRVFEDDAGKPFFSDKGVGVAGFCSSSESSSATGHILQW